MSLAGEDHVLLFEATEQMPMKRCYYGTRVLISGIWLLHPLCSPMHTVCYVDA